MLDIRLYYVGMSAQTANQKKGEVRGKIRLGVFLGGEEGEVKWFSC